MRDAAGIAEGLKAGTPEVLAAWRRDRGGEDGGAEARLVEEVGRLLEIFAEFLRSPEPLEGFSREGATRAMVAKISAIQHDLGRDAVGVIEDYASLRRCVWRFVEGRTDLHALDGGEVARFFVKLMQAADWVTERGLEEFEGIARAKMESDLGRATATDLLTGLPDRELFNRWLLPQAVEEHDRLALIVFDLVDFSGMVAGGNVPRAREALLGLAEAVEKGTPEGALRARFGDDEICVLLPATEPEEAYATAEAVLDNLSRSPEGLRADAGVAGYPEHGASSDELVGSVLWALKTAKRVGGGGIVVAR
ncbi:GGDEF domain-containing protein [Rubrobacter marinus]|uniref:GGDEF domain-containing protein n=1 Tax=Rubrobacter marinus TaxID=2653852 RepID=UPI00140C5819|nr:GGDEF domain-containing protein [Rubrobacter marinus]